MISLFCLQKRSVGLLFLLWAVTGCSSDAARAQHYLDSGKRYFYAQKFAESAIEFQKSLKLNPRLRDAHYYLGLSRFRLRDYAGAHRELKEVVDASPSFIDARLDLADLLLTGNQPEKAREQVEAVQSIDRDNARAATLLGRTYLAENSAAPALREFRRAATLSAKDPTIWGLAAVAEIAEKQYAAAESDSRRALQLSPNSAEAYLNLSNLFRLMDRTVEAESVLRLGMEKTSDALSIDAALAEIYYQQGRLQEIESLFAKRKGSSHNSAAGLAAGDFWLAHNQVSRAIAEYESERQERPDEFVDKKLVSAYITSGRVADAERINAPLVKKHPNDLDLRAFDGALSYFHKDFEKSAQELQLVLKDEPKSLLANYYLGLTWMALEQPDRAQSAFLGCVALNDRFFHAYLRLADLAMRSADWKAASSYGMTLLRLDPQGAQGYAVLGESYLATHDVARAKAVLRRFKTLPTLPADFYELSSKISLLEGQPKAAAGALRQALAVAADQFAVIARFSSFSSQHGQIENAIPIVKAWTEETSSRPDAYELVGRLYLLGHDPEHAREACQKALALDHDRWLSHFLMGEAARQGKHFVQAEAEFAEAIQRNPRLIAAYVAAGDIEMDQGQYTKAKSYFDEGKKQNPDNLAVARELLRWYAERDENVDEALNEAQELKSKFPEDHYLSDTLGWLYYRKGLYSLALQQLKPAAAGLTDNARVQYHLGMTYFQAGQQDRARIALSRALKLGLASARADEVQQTLDKLNKG